MLIMDKSLYYTIGEMAEICEVNTKTLRYYDQIGLLVPQFKNSETGYRYYYKEQIFKLCIIKKLQLMDFSLKEIKVLISSDNITTYEKEIRKKIQKLNVKINFMKKICDEGNYLIEKIALRNELVNSFQHKDIPKLALDNPSQIKVEYIPTKEILFTKKEVKLYNNFEISIERWLEVFRLAEKKGLIANGSIILTYCNENVMDQFFKSSCNLEISLPIHNTYQEKSPYIKLFGGFQAVTISHIGEYHSIMNTHVKALRWIEANGYQIDGKISEEYIISPFDFKSEDTYLTKIIIPVKK